MRLRRSEIRERGEAGDERGQSREEEGGGEVECEYPERNQIKINRRAADFFFFNLYIRYARQRHGAPPGFFHC